MTHAVLDTNVLVAANGRETHASEECQQACVRAINAVRAGGPVVLDDAYHILNEYRANVDTARQRGVGDAFLIWLYDNYATPERCVQYRITPHPARGFAEFPDESALAGFDRSDRKFVAVALVCPSGPEILNATDPDWRDHYHALTRHGLRIRFLCPDLVAAPGGG